MAKTKYDYNYNKNRIRDLAIEYSNHSGKFEWIDKEGISWGGVAILSDYFYKNGKRYGLLKEFRENAIC